MLIIGKLCRTADFVVVRIVGRRDLHAAGAQLGLGPFVGHQRNLAVQQRQPQLAAGAGHVAQLDRAAAASCGGARGCRRAALRCPARSFRGRGDQLLLQLALRPCPAPRPDRDAPPRPCRRASFRAAWWRSSQTRLARLRIDHRIAKMPEVAVHGFVKHFVVADGRLQERVPIHQPLAAIDQAVA